MLHLLIDAGNTRIKWRAVDRATGWQPDDPTGTALLGNAADLKTRWQGFGLDAAWIACVADEQIFTGLCAALPGGPEAVPVHRARAQAQQCGLRSGYPEPGQLGADRWIGAIGARSLFPDRLLVIATLGTATTIDVIVPENDPAGPAQGTFFGGVILPGIDLMRRALSQGTARLPLASGNFNTLANNTDDAIISGILHAQAGAIERICESAARETGYRGIALCLLGGGAADQVAPLLTPPRFTTALRIEQDLVLRGLSRLASEAQ